MSKTSGKRDAHAAADACIELLRDDPPRLKRLLREAAGLADDVSEVLADAKRPHESKKVHLLSKILRGAAFLPASLAAAGLKKALSKLDIR